MSLDPATIQQQAIDGYTNGLLTRNEARSKLGLPPINNGDEFVEKEGGKAEDGKAVNN